MAGDVSVAAPVMDGRRQRTMTPDEVARSCGRQLERAPLRDLRFNDNA